MKRRKRRLPENVTTYLDRHGVERFRWRKTGFKPHSFKAAYGTAEFDAEYALCRAQMLPIGANRSVPGSIDDLVTRYLKSAAFLKPGEGTQHSNRLILERFRAAHGKKPAAGLTAGHVEAILIAAMKKRREGKRMVGGPEGARKLRKELRKMFKYAEREGLVARNPIDQADALPISKSKGFHTWTEEEIAQYQRKHALGTQARLALEIALWTGQRRGDVYQFGPRHLVNGRVEHVQEKTGKSMVLPVAPQLMAAIKAVPLTGTETFIVNAHGKPFSKAGFGNRFRKWCDEAGLPHCSIHGLRLAITRRMAEASKTHEEMKAVGGWTKSALVDRYAREAAQERLADGAIVDLANRFGDPPVTP